MPVFGAQVAQGDEHNYFITGASDEGAAVLVHNQIEGSFCGAKIKNPDIVDDLLVVQALLDAKIVEDVTQVLAKLDEGEVDDLLRGAGLPHA